MSASGSFVISWSSDTSLIMSSAIVALNNETLESESFFSLAPAAAGEVKTKILLCCLGFFYFAILLKMSEFVSSVNLKSH